MTFQSLNTKSVYTILKSIVCFKSLYVMTLRYLKTRASLVVEVLDSQSRGPMFKTTGKLQGRLSRSSF